MALTPEEIEMIEREAIGEYQFNPEKKHNVHEVEAVDRERKACVRTATKYLIQLKSERERAGKLMEALEWLMEGVAGLPPLTAIAGVLEQQYLAGEIAITEYKNNNQ